MKSIMGLKGIMKVKEYRRGKHLLSTIIQRSICRTLSIKVLKKETATKFTSIGKWVLNLSIRIVTWSIKTFMDQKANLIKSQCHTGLMNKKINLTLKILIIFVKTMNSQNQVFQKRWNFLHPSSKIQEKD